MKISSASSSTWLNKASSRSLLAMALDIVFLPSPPATGTVVVVSGRSVTPSVVAVSSVDVVVVVSMTTESSNFSEDDSSAFGISVSFFVPTWVEFAAEINVEIPSTLSGFPVVVEIPDRLSCDSKSSTSSTCGPRSTSSSRIGSTVGTV